MSWVTNKASVVSVLTTNSYKELANNLTVGEQPSSYTHKGYSLKPVGKQIVNQTSAGQLYSDIAELKVSYIVKDTSDYGTQYDAWTTLLTAIKATHYGYAEAPKFMRVDNNNKYAVGTVTLYIGAQGC